MRILCLVMATVPSLTPSAAYGQPGVNYGLPPTEPGHVGASWSPLGPPAREVPGCVEPAIVEWRVIEPQRRWLVAVREGVEVPEWPRDAALVRVRTTGEHPREVLALEETYYTAPEERGAYPALVSPECVEPSEPFAWAGAMRNVSAVFHCPSERAFVLFATHTDGLVLRATIPEGTDAAPRCEGLSLMASLVPLRSEARGCRGRCSFYEGVFRSDDETEVFEVEWRVGGSRVRRLFEVVPVGRERFEVFLSFDARSGARSREGERTSLVFLGSELVAREQQGEGRYLGAVMQLYAPGGGTHGFPRYDLGVSVTGRGEAFQRGLRFVQGLSPGDELARFQVRQWQEKPPRGSVSSSTTASRWLTIEGAVVVAVLGTAAVVVWIAVRARRRSRAAQTPRP